MFKFFTRPVITPAITEAWLRRYGDKLHLIHLDGKTVYLREPTESEIRKLLLKYSSNGQQLNETKYFKKILELCFLGGDREIIDNQNVSQNFKELWQIL